MIFMSGGVVMGRGEKLNVSPAHLTIITQKKQRAGKEGNGMVNTDSFHTL